jgi:hypothetical protein
LRSFGSRLVDSHATKRSPFAEAKAELIATQDDKRLRG